MINRYRFLLLVALVLGFSNTARCEAVVDSELIKSISCSINIKIDKETPSLAKITFYVENKSDKTISLDLDGFPDFLIFNPKNQEPLDVVGIDPTKLDLPSLTIPFFIEGKKRISKTVSMKLPATFSLNLANTFKLLTIASFVDKQGVSLNRVSSSFFLTGPVSDK